MGRGIQGNLLNINKMILKRKLPAQNSIPGKTILALIFILEFGLIKAQTYVPFPDTNAYWNEIKQYQGICDPPDYCKYTFYFDGDTLINAESYHKVYVDDSIYISYMGGLREIDKKVYFFWRDCADPVLLYDFGLNVGDSVRLACDLCYFEGPLYMKVTSVDSVLIGDTSYRRRINFDYGPEQSWIEGIGSVGGLFYPAFSCLTCTCFFKLICFEQDGITLYENEDLVPCFNYALPAGNIDPASEWRVNYFMAEPGYMQQTYYKDFIDGDTVIGSLEYFKVYASGYSYIEYLPPGFYNYFEHSPEGLLREQNQKWYTYYEDHDTLLFDFTLGLYDTVYSALTNVFDDSAIIVTAIDSVLVDNEYKKRMRLNFEEGEGAQYIIEDIGASSGLFENMSFFEWGSDLVCFAKNGISLWGVSTEECDLAVNIGEINNNLHNCNLYPNPACKSTNLSIPPGFGNVKITLIDSYGKIVFQELKKEGHDIRISLHSCLPGLYLVLIENDNQRQTIKLLVQ
jgi:hypothetical protein